MSVFADFRRRARATWASGDWDSCARLIEPVGAVVLDRIDLRPRLDLVDVGTGTGGNVAIPAAQRGANVVGVDIAPELFEHAQRRAAEAGVDIQWVEGDAQELPFADESFDRVISTFGAMFAPDHVRAAGELVRVCRPGGRVAMTTWVTDGYAGELFKLTGSFLPPPPAGVQPPPLWGVESHVEEVFAAAGVTPDVAHETVELTFASEQDAVDEYMNTFGPFVTARTVLEPQGRWPKFVQAFAELIQRFNLATDGSAHRGRVPADHRRTLTRPSSGRNATCVCRSSTGGISIDEMDELPENLSALDHEALLEERDARDEVLRPLFRRWPSLSRFETMKLRRVYNEQVRLARWIGRTRRGVKRAPGA